jgi:hypothetical protein
MTQDEFIKKAKLKHGNKYDYSKVEYKGCKQKINIICPIHGEFKQTPDKHLTTKFACNKCSTDNRVLRIKNNSFNVFSKKGADKFNGNFIYDNSDYIDSSTKINIKCVKHNYIFMQEPNSHLNSNNPCPLCAKEYENSKTIEGYSKKQTEFINKSILKYNDKYDYSQVLYYGAKIPVSIVCLKHGLFKQLPNNHLKIKFGCPICAIENKPKSLGGYNYGFFEENPEMCDVRCVLYYIRVGKIFKIGVTTQKIEKRISEIKSTSKNKDIDIIWAFEDTLLNSFKYEQSILLKYEKYRIKRFWSTELFDRDVIPDLAEVKNIKI